MIFPPPTADNQAFRVHYLRTTSPLRDLHSLLIPQTQRHPVVTAGNPNPNNKARGDYLMQFRHRLNLLLTKGTRVIFILTLTISLSYFASATKLVGVDINSGKLLY